MSILTTTVHGVCLEINGQGVLIIGASGIGKSETALGLIKQGHRLIADDLVNISLINNQKLLASSPPLLQDFLFIRDLGLLNIRQLFGQSSISSSQVLQLIIQFYSRGETVSGAYALAQPATTESLLGQNLPCFKVALHPGRDTVLLIETLVSNFLLGCGGYCAADEFNYRQQQLLNNGTNS